MPAPPYLGAMRLCNDSPSATSPATSVIRTPTAAKKIGGLPYGVGPGSNLGVIRAWVKNSPSKRSGSLVFHACHIARP